MTMFRNPFFHAVFNQFDQSPEILVGVVVKRVLFEIIFFGFLFWNRNDLERFFQNESKYHALLTIHQPEKETKEVHHKFRAVREAIRKAHQFQSQTENNNA